jgi:hypothetical protein
VYARATSENRLIAWAASNEELRLAIEPINGRIDLRSFDRLWSGISGALPAQSPTLDSASQIDEATGQLIQTGRVVLTAEAKQKEVYLPLALAIVSLIWIGIAFATFVEDDRLKFFGGSMSSLTAGAFTLVLLFVNLKEEEATVDWNPLSFERAVLDAIREQLPEDEAHMEMYPMIGALRPDAVVHAADDRLVVLDVKYVSGKGRDLHFASVAQAAAYARALEDQSADVAAFVVTNGRITPRWQELARQMGIPLWSVDAANLRESLQPVADALGGGPEIPGAR